MTRTDRGAIRLFQIAGITVSLHWTWLLVALFELRGRGAAYGHMLWNGLEYLTLFGLVLLHEFGHALACRSVGGRAERILLWPLGGVAFVQPPFRPGAYLWSIAAGPLVNVVLVPLTIAAFAAVSFGFAGAAPNLEQYVMAIVIINLVLLVFNLLPIYPLDGGQILRALLWFVIGPVRSLSAAAWLGLLGAAGLVLLAIFLQSIWLGVLAIFAALQCAQGLATARRLREAQRVPRHAQFRCPACGEHAPAGPVGRCQDCGRGVDPVAEVGCPHCRRVLETTECLFCGRTTPRAAWRVGIPAGPEPPQA